MVLAVHSNTSYLSKPKAHSRVGGHFFLSSNTTVPPNNGAILIIAHIIKNVMSSATKAELAGLYIMAGQAVYRLVWAEPKTIATSAILYLIKLVSYHFTLKPPCFYDTNRKSLKRAF
jgi:hypothetical protein